MCWEKSVTCQHLEIPIFLKNLKPGSFGLGPQMEKPRPQVYRGAQCCGEIVGALWMIADPRCAITPGNLWEFSCPVPVDSQSRCTPSTQAKRPSEESTLISDNIESQYQRKNVTPPGISTRRLGKRRLARLLDFPQLFRAPLPLRLCSTAASGSSAPGPVQRDARRRTAAAGSSYAGVVRAVGERGMTVDQIDPVVFGVFD